MTQVGSTRYGAELVTFYHPSFWGLDTYEQLLEVRNRDPKLVWATILDALGHAGVTAFELCFPPADWRSAVDAYGSASAFREELDSRGLALKSGFAVGEDWISGRPLDGVVDEATAYADFLAEAGGDVLVVGPPLRRARDEEPPLFVDLGLASRFADVLHRVGAETIKRGVRLAVHPEAHSIFCTRRDIDLLMDLTDPEYVFFCPDTAHITLAGSEPVSAVTAHIERVVLAHWKDAIGPMPKGLSIDPATIHDEHRPFMCTLGAGVVDWTAWSTLYGQSVARELRVLELDAVPDPVGEIKQAIEFLDSLDTSRRESSPTEAVAR